MASSPRGQRLLPAVIDDYANSEPDKVYASVPVDDNDLKEGYKEFTYRHFAKAVDAASHWLDKTLGKTNGTFETFIYLGARDLRYAIMSMAAAKTGRVVLFPSLFGSMESHIFLATQTNARHILYSDDLEPLAYEIHTNFFQLPCLLVPKQNQWLHEYNDSFPHYPFTKTFEEAEWDPVFIIHTSGTTGLPKPVVYTHGHMSTLDGYFDKPLIDGREINVTRARSSRLYNSLPVFHFAGLISSLIMVVFADIVAVMGPPDKAPTLEIAEAVIDNSDADSGFFAPFLIELLGREPRTMAKMKKLKCVMYAGAPLSNYIGNELANTPGLSLINGIGNTEGGGWPTMTPEPEDWQWFKFHPDCGFTFEPQDPGPDCEMFEVVAHRTARSEKMMIFWRTFPDENVIHTKDLLSPHPTKEGLWRYRCRLDDLILLTGEVKLYCRTIEEAISEHPFVTGVLVGGDRRSRPFMLIELVEHKADSSAALDQVWSEVVEAENCRNAPSARIKRDMTVLVDGRKPLIRSPKGGIERRKTFDAFEEAIDALYGGSVGNESIKRTDSAKVLQQRGEYFRMVVPGTEDIDREV